MQTLTISLTRQVPYIVLLKNLSYTQTNVNSDSLTYNRPYGNNFTDLIYIPINNGPTIIELNGINSINIEQKPITYYNLIFNNGNSDPNLIANLNILFSEFKSNIRFTENNTENTIKVETDGTSNTILPDLNNTYKITLSSEDNVNSYVFAHELIRYFYHIFGYPDRNMSVDSVVNIMNNVPMFQGRYLDLLSHMHIHNEGNYFSEAESVAHELKEYFLPLDENPREISNKNNSQNRIAPLKQINKDNRFEMLNKYKHHVDILDLVYTEYIEDLELRFKKIPLPLLEKFLIKTNPKKIKKEKLKLRQSLEIGGLNKWKDNSLERYIAGLRERNYQVYQNYIKYKKNINLKPNDVKLKTKK